MFYSTDNYDFGGTPETSTIDYYEDELKDDIEGTVYILGQYSHLLNKRGGWNKRRGDAKVAKSVNVEGVIF